MPTRRNLLYTYLMSEEPPKLPEHSESEVKLIEELRARGLEDLEVVNLLTEWNIREEALIGKAPGDQIEFERRRGRLYAAGNCRGDALESFEGARRQAIQLGREDLCEEIMREMDELGL